MKKFYSKFRISLMTFAFGLASVFMMTGSLQFMDDIIVNSPKVQYEPTTIFFSLPKIQSRTPFIISIEKEVDPREFSAGTSGGITCDEAIKRAKNKSIKIPNCE